MKKSRRNFLRGLGGAAVALPFLPSLLSQKEAQAAPGYGQRFIALRTGHGGLLRQNMFPGASGLTDTMPYAGYNIRRGNLALTTAGANASLSPVLTAPSSRFTPGLAAKMNVIRGLDVPYYMAHNTGGALGNYGDTAEPQFPRTVTCDQVLAWSPKFYDDLSTVLMRTMVIGSNDLSWGYSTPGNPNSTVQSLNSENDSLSLFNQIYVPPAEPVEQRTPIVDLVLEDYHRLRQSNRRLSAGDRARLDDYISRLDELQRKLAVTVSCGDVQTPTQSSTDLYSPSFFREPDSHRQFWGLLNEVIAIAMACGTSRIATVNFGDNWDTGAAGWFSDYPGDWHQEIAHQCHNSTEQGTLAQATQRFFEHVYLDLMERLDSIQDVDGTLLDSSLLMWTQESGTYTHDPISIPVITAGSSAGYFNTGNYVDYTNPNVVAHDGNGDPAGEVTHVGLMYNQFLGTVMQSMGLSPSDYEQNPGQGYGPIYDSVDTWYAGHGKYSSAVRQAAGDTLPFIRS